MTLYTTGSASLPKHQTQEFDNSQLQSMNMYLYRVFVQYISM